MPLAPTQNPASALANAVPAHLLFGTGTPGRAATSAGQLSNLSPDSALGALTLEASFLS